MRILNFCFAISCNKLRIEYIYIYKAWQKLSERFLFCVILFSELRTFTEARITRLT